MNAIDYIAWCAPGRRLSSAVPAHFRRQRVGITKEQLPLVFQRFWQAHTGVSREFGGLGIGLALARHLVEMHGGTIAVASEGLGRGATFTITLPSAGAVLARERNLRSVGK